MGLCWLLGREMNGLAMTDSNDDRASERDEVRRYGRTKLKRDAFCTLKQCNLTSQLIIPCSEDSDEKDSKLGPEMKENIIGLPSLQFHA